MILLDFIRDKNIRLKGCAHRDQRVPALGASTRCQQVLATIILGCTVYTVHTASTICASI